MQLQPTHVFIEELTRINRAYWLSRFSFKRNTEILKAIARTGFKDEDPRVDAIWPSTVDGEQRHTTITLSRYRTEQAGILGDLRVASVLHASSAFENALVNLFSLALLYRPQACNSLRLHSPVPSILANRAAYQALRADAIAAASGMLKGDYSKRVKEFRVRFAVRISSIVQLRRLDHHYHVRNLIAHDQGLLLSDGPDLPAVSVLGSRHRVSEKEWRAMLKVFYRCILLLDDGLRKNVVSDGGLALAIAHILSQALPIRLGELCGKARTQWRMGAVSINDVEALVTAWGYKIRTTGKNSARYMVE